MERLIGLCRELVNARSDDEAAELTKQIAKELEAIDESERIRDVAWREKQKRFAKIGNVVPR